MSRTASNYLPSVPTADRRSGHCSLSGRVVKDGNRKTKRRERGRREVDELPLPRMDGFPCRMSRKWDAARWREKENDASFLDGGVLRRASSIVVVTPSPSRISGLGARANRGGAVEHHHRSVHRGYRPGLSMKIANLRNLRREVLGALSARDNDRHREFARDPDQ